MESIVRLAEEGDFPALEKLEKIIWQKGNLMTPFDRRHFTEWRRIYQKGFIVAENENGIGGFGFSQIIQIEDLLNDPRLKKFELITDNGFCLGTHTNNGNYHFGITLCSNTLGAGKKLFEYARAYLESTGIPFLTPCRLPILQSYFERHQPFKDGMAEEEIVLGYVEKCERIIIGKEKREGFPVDPNLNFHLRAGWLTRVRILPKNFLDDPKSRGFSVLLKQEL